MTKILIYLYKRKIHASHM
ncbi:hypothetical protein CAJAP_01262 [Camponotus japonicus]